MACLIAVLMRYANKKYEKNKNKTKNFTANTQYLNIKAPSNNVKMQSDKTLTTQSYFFLTIQQMRIFFN